MIADDVTLQGQLYRRGNEIRCVKESKMKDILEWMVDGLSIRSDGGGVSNLACSDLTAVRGRQVLNKCIWRWLMVGRGSPVRRWGTMVRRWSAMIVRIHAVRPQMVVVV